MERIKNQIQGETLFVGIDLHKRRWHITISTVDVEIFSNSIVGRWKSLRYIAYIKRSDNKKTKPFLTLPL